jgi:hypothetical protein
MAVNCTGTAPKSIKNAENCIRNTKMGVNWPISWGNASRIVKNP